MDLRTPFIALFLLGQLIFPITYYLDADDAWERYDERFAWRMFSPIRMVRCDASFTVAGKQRPLMSHYHATWSTLSKRGRPDVLDGLVEHMCEQGEPVTLRLRCREADGEQRVLEDGQEDLCLRDGGLR